MHRKAITGLLVVLFATACTSAPAATTSAPSSAGRSPTKAPTEPRTSNAPATAEPTPIAPAMSPSSDPISVGYPDLPGWIVFEHFGQAPDGSTSELDFDNRMIWMVRADGSGLHELAPGTPSAGKSSPDISADGEMVAFNSWDPALIYEAPIDGNDVSQVSAACDGLTASCQELEPAYSADRAKMAFVRFDEGETTVIGIRDLATGAVDWLEKTRVPISESYVSQPSWSPGGDEIVYYRVWWDEADEHPSDTRVFIVKSDDSEVRELPQPVGRWAADPDWSPDGSQIVFSSTPNRETEGWSGGPAGGIYTIKPDGSDLKLLCAPCLDSGWAPSWTSDGRIFFWGWLTFALMNADGSGMAHINQPELTWFGEELGYGYAGFLQPTE